MPKLFFYQNKIERCLIKTKIKNILISISVVIVLIITYIVVDNADYASGVNEDRKTGQYLKWNLSDFKEGDIIFQTSKSAQSKAIQIATKSKYSHLGIIYFKDNVPFVFEAVQPVKLTPLKDWILRGVDEHFVLKRLKEREKYLTGDNIQIIRNVCEKFRGKNYDSHFGWDNNKMYCSELVWKLYDSIGLEVGELQKLEDFDLTSKAVKQKLEERYGKNIPLKEIVISPVSIFNSNLLEVVLEN